MKISVQKTCLTLLASILTLSGCQNLEGTNGSTYPRTQPQSQTYENDIGQEIRIDLSDLWSQSAYTLVSSVNSETHPAEARIRRLIAANKLLDNQQIEASRTQLSLIDKNELNSYEQTLLDLAQTKVAFQQNNFSQALSMYEKSSLSDTRLEQLPQDEYVTAQWLKASLYEQNGQTLNAALARIDFAETLTRSDIIAENENAIWSSLTSVSSSELANASAQNQSYYRLGWLQLAYGVTSQPNPRQSIEDWQYQWSSHPAYGFSSNLMNNYAETGSTIISSTEQIDSDTTVYTTPTTEQPVFEPSTNPGINYGSVTQGAQRITVILPMSGRFSSIGETIIEGIKNAPNSDSKDFTFVDSESLGSAEALNSAIYEASANGQELVIGPLQKEKVNQLQASNIPVIALNESEYGNHEHNIFHLSLNPADEARQAASTMISRGLTRAAVMYIDSAWGEGISSDFSQTFTAMGGTIAQVQPFSKSDNLNKMVKTFLKDNFDSGQLRESLSSNSTSLLNIQTIYVVGGHEEIRQIKPALNYYYAGAIPVYAISNAYSEFNTYGNRDLRDVCIVDIPAMGKYVSDDSFADSTNADKPSELRFYSLGQDAMLLANSLPSVSSYSFSDYGLTGQLSLTGSSTVSRELNWYTFDQQKLVEDGANECRGY